MDIIHLNARGVEDAITGFKLDIERPNYYGKPYKEKKYHTGFLDCLYQLTLVENKERNLILDLINKQKEVL